jgi:hypothetical protein
MQHLNDDQFFRQVTVEIEELAERVKKRRLEAAAQTGTDPLAHAGLLEYRLAAAARSARWVSTTVRRAVA